MAQDEREWGGPPVRMDVVLAGGNVVATDAVATRIMGHDPAADFGTPPYLFDRNPLKLAAEAGLGPVAPDGYELVGDDLERFRRQFRVARDGFAESAQLRRSVAAQALRYLEDRDDLLPQYAGRHIAYAGGRVIAHAATVDELGTRTELAARAGREAGGVFLKKVEAAAADPECMEVYAALAA